MSDMCEELYDPFQDQVECARYRAERDALAQAVQTVCERMEAHCLDVEGMDDSLVASWTRDLRAALGSLHAPKMYGADGEILLRGETVYNVVDGEEYRVREFVNGVLDVCVETADGDVMTLCHDVLTHTKPEPPDTWERIEEDKGLNPFDCWKKVGHKLWAFDNA